MEIYTLLWHIIIGIDNQESVRLLYSSGLKKNRRKYGWSDVLCGC